MACRAVGCLYDANSLDGAISAPLMHSNRFLNCVMASAAALLFRDDAYHHIYTQRYHRIGSMALLARGLLHLATYYNRRRHRHRNGGLRDLSLLAWHKSMRHGDDGRLRYSRRRA